MKLLTDYQSIQIRLTDERLTHILNHPELANMEFAILETLQNPEQVRVSRTDKNVILLKFYLLLFKNKELIDKKLNQ